MYNDEDFQGPQSVQREVRRQEDIDNKAISSFAGGHGNKFYMIEPVHEKQVVGVVLKDENDVPIKINDKLLYEEKEILVFKEFKSREITLPVPDFFNDAVPSSTLSPSDVEFIREIDSLIPYLGSKMVKYGKNYSSFINLCYTLKNSFADSAKGYEGRGIRMAKTTISKGEMIQEMYNKDKNEEEQKPKKQTMWEKLGRNQ